MAALAGRPFAIASPGIELDDPATDELARLRAAGSLPPYTGGLRPLTEARVQALRRAAGLPPDPRLLSDLARGPWLAPVRRLHMRAVMARDRLRAYSTDRHPRDLAGAAAISCERREGRSCGNGAGVEWEVDAAAGYGTWIWTAARVRAAAGTRDREAGVFVDRAHAGAELGPIALLVGRDILAIGPSRRTQAMWGENAPPLDQVRLSTARPLAIVGAGGSILRLSGLYFIGRLREPQVFDGTLVDGSRGQLDLWDTVEVGLTHLIQLGGDGAPRFSAGDFIREHFQHNAPQSLGFANHRLSFDVAVTLPRLAGARVYYELAAEDMRDEVGSMLARDSDHVFGVELRRLAPRIGLLVELTRTGVRSHEHAIFTTGATSAGRIVGNPLGPDSIAAFAGLEVDVGEGRLWPWLELVRQSSDLYSYGTGAIVRTENGPDERRVRAGTRAAFPLAAALRVECRVLAERVDTADFMAGRRRWNAALELAATWTPGWRVGSN